MILLEDTDVRLEVPLPRSLESELDGASLTLIENRQPLAGEDEGNGQKEAEKQGVSSEYDGFGEYNVDRQEYEQVTSCGAQV